MEKVLGKNARQIQSIMEQYKNNGFEPIQPADHTAREIAAATNRSSISGGIDQRKYHRDNIDNLIIYVLVDEDGNEVGQDTGTALNVSQGGMLLQTNAKITSRYLILATTDIEDQLIVNIGKVVFSMKSGNGFYKTGISFRGDHSDNVIFRKALIHLYQERQARRKICDQNRLLRRSMSLAQEVQQSLIPCIAPYVDGFEAAGCSLYCEETGGDYIDYLEDKDGLNIVVGDVADHGVAAALLMTSVRAMLRMRAKFEGSPADLIGDLNNILVSDVKDTGRFMTLMYLRINSAQRSITWVRAGHEPGLRYKPQTEEAIELRGKGLALGVMEDIDYEEYTISSVDSGEIIVLGTDGVTETRNTEGTRFGRERLMEIVRENAAGSASEILEACMKALQQFRGDMPREDDETLVVIKAE
jgi:serine phosphatase RsbU (regulator of sigma subunit)